MKYHNRHVLFLWISVWVLMGLSLLSLAWAALVDRPLFSDGIIWTFQILNKKTFNCDWQFIRYADALLQIPAVLALKLNFGELIAVKLNSLSYSLNPFVSILACAWILKRRERLDLLIFPILSFATITQTVIAAPFTVVSGLLSLLWPLFFLAVLPGRGFFYWFGLLLLNLGVIFEHETGVVFLLMLVFLKAYEAYFAPLDKRQDHLVLFSIFSVTAIVMVYNILQSPAGSRTNFLNQFLSGDLDIYQVSSLIFIALFFLIYKKISRISEIYKMIFICISAVTITFYYTNYYVSETGGSLFWGAVKARTLAALLASVICFVCFLFIKSEKSFSSSENTSKYATSLVIISLALMVSLLHDLGLTRNWIKSMDYIKSQMNEKPGCRQLSETESKEHIIANGFDTRFLPFYSIVIGQQIYNRIGTVLFSEENLKYESYGKIKNFCCVLREGQIAIAGGYMNVEPDWSYNLSPVIQKLNSTSSELICP